MKHKGWAVSQLATSPSGDNDRKKDEQVVFAVWESVVSGLQGWTHLESTRRFPEPECSTQCCWPDSNPE